MNFFFEKFCSKITNKKIMAINALSIIITKEDIL